MLQSILKMKARFIGEPIDVGWENPPFLQKKPTCPDWIIWQGERFDVVIKLAEWRDYRRRGRMSKNMRLERLSLARQRGSWGVGRFYFHVVIADGRTLEIYYDRAVQDSDRRKGSWFLSQELL